MAKKDLIFYVLISVLIVLFLWQWLSKSALVTQLTKSKLQQSITIIDRHRTSWLWTPACRCQGLHKWPNHWFFPKKIPACKQLHSFWGRNWGCYPYTCDWLGSWPYVQISRHWLQQQLHCCWKTKLLQRQWQEIEVLRQWAIKQRIWQQDYKKSG